MNAIKVHINKAQRKKAGFPRRDDIVKNLPRTAAQKISTQLKINKSYISRVLSGHISPTGKKAKQIIEQAELMAAVHIFNNQYCKVIPSIDPLEISISN